MKGTISSTILSFSAVLCLFISFLFSGEFFLLWLAVIWGVIGGINSYRHAKKRRELK